MCMYTHEREGELLLLLASMTQAVMTILQVWLHRLGSNAGVSLQDMSIQLRTM
jgi:hypothetical protein